MRLICNFVNYHSGFMPSRQASLWENLILLYEIPASAGMTIIKYSSIIPIYWDMKE